MELEFHQLDLRYEVLRRRSPEREKKLLASLAQLGQQVPIVVVAGAGGGQQVVVDGFKRVRAIKQLKQDTVLATPWDLGEAEALILERLMRASGADDPFEQGWLLSELQRRFELSHEELARRFDKSQSWVSRRISLVEQLSPELQQRVQEGLLVPYAAAKYLVPMARANRTACTQLVSALGKKKLSSRQLGALYGGWLEGDEQVRERLLADPWLFLRAQEEADRTSNEKPPAQYLLSELSTLAAISRRVSRRLHEGLARQIFPHERDEMLQCLAQAKADTQALFHLFDQELGDARSGPTHSHP
jgi:ParB family transcriptional regulator, chromosome partitioning protein